MKKVFVATMATTLIGLASFISNVDAKTITVTENFDDTNIQFERIHHLNEYLNIYSLDETFNPVAGDLTQLVTTYVRGGNRWVDQKPIIVEDPNQGNVMSFGTSTVDSVPGWTGWYGQENLVYTINQQAYSGSVSFKYKNNGDGRGIITVFVESVDDYGVRQWVETIKFPESNNSEGWQNYTVPASVVESMANGREFNRIQVCEWDISTVGQSYLDDVVVNFEVPDDDILKYVEVAKEGWYTAEILEGQGNVEVFVDGEYIGEFTDGIADLGILPIGSTISLSVDGWDADSIYEYDYQSWDFNFLNGEVVIYVEDPPIPVVEEEPTKTNNENRYRNNNGNHYGNDKGDNNCHDVKNKHNTCE